MLKKIIIIAVLVVAASALAWHLYHGDGKLRPVSKAEGRKLMAQIREGIEKNQAGIKNGCGKVTERQYITFPDEGSAERETTCYTVFADEDYKIRVIGSKTQCKGPKQPFGERLKEFGRSLIGRSSAKTTRAPLDSRYLDPELVRNSVYRGNEAVTTKYVPGRKYAHTSGVNYDDMQNDCRAAMPFVMRRDYMEEPHITRSFRTEGAIVYEVRCLEPVVKGRQRIGRDECLVVEEKTERRLIKNTLSQFPAGSSSHRTVYWICPSKGYCALRTQNWDIDPAFNKSNDEILGGVETMDVREYKPGVWGIARQEITSFSTTLQGVHYKQSIHTITYDRLFRLNVPKSKLDLGLKLPKGTKVVDEVKHKTYVVK